MEKMRISNPDVRLIENEAEVIARLLSLKNASVLELGCGKAEKTRLIAGQAASVLALEVDEVQLARNSAITDLPNVKFQYGGAEKIPAPDASFDVVLMFKSLHHVPTELMDDAFAEIHRVLKPGGVAYISEPVYAGDFNEILRLFHDEKIVREHAFAAIVRAVSSKQLALVEQVFFLQAMHFENFARYEEQVLKVTHTEHRLSAELLSTVQKCFEQHMTPSGANFTMPIRIDLLMKNT